MCFLELETLGPHCNILHSILFCVFQKNNVNIACLIVCLDLSLIPALLAASLSSSLPRSFMGCRCVYGWGWEMECVLASGSRLRWRFSMALTAWMSLPRSFLISSSRCFSRSRSFSLCTSCSHCLSRSISRVRSFSRSRSLSCWRSSSSICSLRRVETHTHTNGVRCNTLDRNQRNTLSERPREHGRVLMMFASEDEELCVCEIWENIIWCCNNRIYTHNYHQLCVCVCMCVCVRVCVCVSVCVCVCVQVLYILVGT